ncbi:hypothetical protein T05_16001 [Trichinella murrelli]|uniref:Uncharacterized protein n=1 Tax=Trichinella murrelli TaxID=144512 RepID=A0A0V0T3I7_9BILA|nr:hypothetical protein T05_16001 [Trichinella murrelli]
MFSDDGHEHSLSPPHNKLSDGIMATVNAVQAFKKVYAISRSPSVTAFIKFLSGIRFSLKPSATTTKYRLSCEGIELYFRYSSYHPEASTPRNPLFFSGQLSLFITPNPLWESLL